MQQLVRVRPANRRPTEKHNAFQLLHTCRIPPDDGLQICPKHVEVDWRNNLRINSASSWFVLHSYIPPSGDNVWCTAHRKMWGKCGKFIVIQIYICIQSVHLRNFLFYLFSFSYVGVPLEISNYFRSSPTEQYKFGKRVSRRQRHCVPETALVSLTVPVAPCWLFLTRSTPDAATSSSLLCDVWPARSTAGVLFFTSRE